MSPSTLVILLHFYLLHGENVAGVKKQSDLVNNKQREDSSEIGDDEMSWTVEDCVSIKMAAQIKFFPNRNIFLTKSIPASATVSPTSSCSSLNSTTTQVITLEWSDTDLLSGILSRNLSISFSLNTTSTTPMYGVSMVTSMYELSSEQMVLANISHTGNAQNTTDLKNKSVSKFIRMTSNTMNPLQFAVPQNRSFLCDESLTMEMLAELVNADGTLSETLQKAVLTMKTIQFDAFRPSSFSSQFQPATSCSSHSSDLLPIVVGGGLVGLVLFMLVSYLVGRRKTKVKGYATMQEK